MEVVSVKFLLLRPFFLSGSDEAEPFGKERRYLQNETRHFSPILSEDINES
jgi:hypothetical protein